MNPVSIKFSDALLVRVWIWGCKDRGKVAARLLKKFNGHIVGFVDNDESAHNSLIFSLKVYSPEELYEKIEINDRILLCCDAKYHQSICAQLFDNGIDKNVCCLDYSSFDLIQKNWGDFIETEEEPRIISKCCTENDFNQNWFVKIKEKLGWKENRLHRKIWEFVYISKVLEDNRMLIPGKRGLGFAVGTEPLPSFFASLGVDVLATDLELSKGTAELWANSGQNAGGDINKLWRPNILSKEEFDRHVIYKDLDMNEIPGDIGQFDFCWSSCAIEHVGSLELSKRFLKNMINVIKPGGIAVHTTEFNLWSNEDTIEDGFSVIYRRKDFEELKEWYVKHDCSLELSFKRGAGSSEMFLPLPPYEENDTRDHLNLIIGQYASTSYALIIKKLA